MHTTIRHELLDARKAWSDTLVDPCFLSGRGHLNNEKNETHCLRVCFIVASLNNNNPNTVDWMPIDVPVTLYVEQYIFPILLRVFAIFMRLISVKIVENYLHVEQRWAK